jgi:hypothetical protein
MKQTVQWIQVALQFLHPLAILEVKVACPARLVRRYFVFERAIYSFKEFVPV